MESHRDENPIYNYMLYTNTNILCIVLVYTKFSRSAGIMYMKETLHWFVQNCATSCSPVWKIKSLMTMPLMF